MKNSLAAMHPEIADEWSEKNLPLTPDKVTYDSNRQVWWKGATLEPELALEWSDKNKILKPTTVGTGSHKKIIWKGKCGHEWTASVKNRVKGSGCPYCSHNLVLEGISSSSC